MVDEEMRDRLTRLETNQQHFDQTLRQLAQVSSEVSHTLARLTEQQHQHQRMAMEMQNLQHSREEQQQAIALIKQELKPLRDLPSIVQKNTFITNVAAWLAGTLFTGAVGTIFALLKF